MQVIARQSAPEVLAVKRLVRERDGYICTKCGVTNEEHISATGRTLDVHRLVPGSAYAVDGCVSLCRSCHGQEPRRPNGQKRIDEPWAAVVISVRITKVISDALERFIASQRLKSKKQDIGVLALTEFLEREGFWKPEKA